MSGRLLAAIMMVPMWFSASAITYFSAVPSTRRLPAGMTVVNANGVLPTESAYKHGYTTEGWTVEAVDASSYSFVSPSSSETDEAQESSMTTPPFLVENSGSWLRWNAKSLLPGFPEEYDVVVTETGSLESTLVAHIAAEDFDWQTRLVSLESFVGKEISVSFVCRSVNKYMLVVQNIFAGEFEANEWVVTDTTPRYASASEGIMATGSIQNVGMEMENAEIVCRIGDVDLTYEVTDTWHTGDTYDYNFDLPLTLNELTAYSIGIKDEDGNFTSLVTSDVFASHFVRNLVVDEGTGMWCVNCPDGILELDDLKREYSGNIIQLCCHVNDRLANEGYWENLKFYAVPYMMLNRNRLTEGSNTKRFNEEYLTPTTAEIIVSSEIPVHNGMIEVETISHFAEGLDNSDGRYKVGYTLTADFYSPDNTNYYQQNNITFPRGEQYYILPSYIPSTLARFDRVVLDDEYAFSGIEGSLPETLDSFVDYSTSFSITIPKLAENAEEVKVVVFILDTLSGIIMNAASSEVVLTNRINSMSVNDELSISVSPEGRCRLVGVSDNDFVTITVTDVAGRLIDMVRTVNLESKEINLKVPTGISIVTARTAERTAVTKCFTHLNKSV